MQLIPVIDLQNGQVVHAVRGERERYLPVQSRLCETALPAGVARAFRSRLGLGRLYIADLNAIQGNDHPDHRSIIASLAGQEGFEILLDAGVTSAGLAQAWLDRGVRQVVIGAETLPDWESLWTFPSQIPAARLAFSLDLREGKILSSCPELAGLSPLQALSSLGQAGWRTVILLDLARVGSGLGLDRELAAQAGAAAPEIRLIAAGGVTGAEELAEMSRLGLAGVLAATALHNGAITRQQIQALGLASG
jgi:phosphoribosylformimino-5-aminoimidazole carboxamide ribotide isomerase